MPEEVKVTRRYHPMFGCVVTQIRLRSTPLPKITPKTAAHRPTSPAQAPARSRQAPPPPDFLAAVREARASTVPTQRVLAAHEARVIAMRKTGVPDPPNWIECVRRGRL